MNYFLHSLEGTRETQDPNRLQKFRDGSFVVGAFQESDSIIHQGEHWIVVRSSGPYSDKHCMLMYVGASLKTSSLDHCSPEEQEECKELLHAIIKHIPIDTEHELIIGINESLMPGAGKTQSVFRPHFHIVVMSRHRGSESNISTDILEDAQQIKKEFALSARNHRYLQDFMNSRQGTNWQSYNQALILEGQYYAIELSTDLVSFLDDILKLSQDVRSFLDEAYFHVGFNALFTEHGVSMEMITRTPPENIASVWKETYETQAPLLKQVEQLGFSLSLIHRDDGLFIRLRFSDKSSGGNAGSMEGAGHAIKRTLLDHPRVPDTRPFGKYVNSILESLPR